MLRRVPFVLEEPSKLWIYGEKTFPGEGSGTFEHLIDESWLDDLSSNFQALRLFVQPTSAD